MDYKNLNDFIKYIRARDLSKRLFDLDLDPDVSDEQVALKFNQLNIANCQNFTYQEITKLIEKKLVGN